MLDFPQSVGRHKTILLKTIPFMRLRGLVGWPGRDPGEERKVEHLSGSWLRENSPFRSGFLGAATAADAEKE
jgi:hypothetical protein